VTSCDQIDCAYLALTVEDVFRRGLLEPGVPDEADSVRISRVVVLVVLIVGGQQQLREGGGPVQAGHSAVLRPTLVVKVSAEENAAI